MNVDTSIVPARTTSDRRWMVAAIAFALIAAGIRFIQFGIDGANAVLFPWELDYGEGIVWEQMRLMAAGRGYGEIDRFPAIVFHYPPVYHFVTAVVAATGGIDPLVAGRSVSLGATLLIGLLGGTIAAKAVRSQFSSRASAAICGMVAGLAFFCFSPVGFWGPLMRVDMLSMAFSFAAVLAAMTALHRPRFIFLSGALFVAAVFTKQISIVAPAAVFLTYLLVRPRLAWTMAATCMVLGLAVLATLEIVTEGRFVRHIFLYNVNRFDPGRLTSILGQMLSHCFFVAALAIGFAQRVRAGRADYRGVSGIAAWRARLNASPADVFFLMITLYAALAGFIALGVAKSGSNVNYFIEGMAVLAVLLGIMTRDAANAALGLTSVRARGKFGHPLFIPLLIGLQAVMGPPRNEHLDYRDPARIAEMEVLRDMIASASRPVVSDDMIVLRRAGAPVQWEPAIFAELAKTGDWDERPFINLIRKQHFAFFVTAGRRGQRLFDSRYNSDVADAMDAAYPVRLRLAYYTVRLPRPERAAPPGR